MANIYNTANDSWELGTVTPLPALVQSDGVWVQEVRWVGGAAAGHEVVIKSPNGKVLWHAIANGANYHERDFVKNWWKDGFALTKLDSGTVYINMQKGK